MKLLPIRATRPGSFPAARVAAATLALCLAAPKLANATWSVIAVDRLTGRVVIASATCVNGASDFLKGVQAVVVPGKGVAACQSSVDGTHANQMLVFNELKKGTDPKIIMNKLSRDPGFQSRQFGILDLTGRSAGHSGHSNGYVSEDIQGQVPGTQIFYSIQGNILRPGEVVPSAVKAFINNKGALTDRVMAAMEAADDAGGDSRCTCTAGGGRGRGGAATDTAPRPAPQVIPCDGRTSYVSYILMSEPKDVLGQGNLWYKIGGRGGQPATDSVFGMTAENTWAHNNGKYAMYIQVTQPNAGGDASVQVKQGENLNPVKTLRMRYDEWRKTMPATFK
jgi:uncharacterized Ntn-hydrolase superfamily protein